MFGTEQMVRWEQTYAGEQTVASQDRHQSVLTQGGQVLTEIELSIEATRIGGDKKPSDTVDRLNGLGGRMVSWTPPLNGQAAKALFKFENQARRDRFVAEALVIPGVTLVATESPTPPLCRGTTTQRHNR
jgi:hypothetical protein